MKTFRDYLNAQPGLKLGTIRAYAKDARCFERWEEKSLTARQRAGQPLALRVGIFLARREIRPAAHNRYLHSLQHLEQYRDLHAPNEAAGAFRVEHLARAPRPQPAELVLLLPHEIDALLEAVITHGRLTEKWRNSSLISFVYLSDLTLREICSLQIDQLQPTPEAPTHVTIKRNGTDLTIDVPEHARGPLKTWLELRKGSSGTNLEESPYVWPVLSTNRVKRAGDGISEAGVRAILTRYARLAAIQKQVTPTLLRKSRNEQAVAI